MIRRSRLEIYLDILKVIEKGDTKLTQIMYKTNLSYATLQDIFEILIQGGFIMEEMEKNVKRYQITEKGRNALSYYLKSLNGLVDVKQVFVQ